MTALDWFGIGLNTGLVLAWIAVRLGRRQAERAFYQATRTHRNTR
jgi:hypothetical protein